MAPHCLMLPIELMKQELRQLLKLAALDSFAPTMTPAKFAAQSRISMPTDDHKEKPPPAGPDHVTFSQRRMAEALARSLGAHYEGVLGEQLPERLRALIEQLEAKEQEQGDHGE